MKKTISIAIACFNEELNVIPAYNAVKKLAEKDKKYNYEIIFADNNSTDNTKKLMRKLAQKDKNVVCIFLSRNFGPESSGQAALDFATGDAVIPLECDLQDPPELIPELIKKWEEGYDVIVGIRTKIEDNFLMTLARKIFYKVFKKISDIDIPVNCGAFGLMDRKVLKALCSLPEKYRFFRGLRAWVGFKTAYITYHRRKRERGKSSYNFFNYIKHSERGIFGFSYLFLDLIIYVGFLLVLASFLFILIYLLLFSLFGNQIKGSVTILVSIVFFGGIQLSAISVIGKYIQVIVEEAKKRPVYIINETINKK